MTDAEFQAWLESPSAIRCALVEVVANISGVETTLYLSNRGYVTGPAETPANKVYMPYLIGGVSFTESLSLEGSPSIGWGDLELKNADGSLDGYLDYVWAGRAVNVYLGDMSWPRADFQLIFTGLVDDLSSRSRDTLNIKIRDKLDKLNVSMTETLLGGSTSNKDKLLPLCFGECHNITPLLADPATLEYQVHNGAIEDIIEVRDNGVPVSVTKYLATGKFRLTASPVGEVTCSVQGAKPGGTYSNQIATLVQHIVTTYGNDPLVSGDIDTASFTAFASANTQPVGLYLDSKTNVIAACNQLANSVGGQLVMSRLGQLRLLKVDLPASGTATYATSSDMLERSLSISDSPKVVAAVKLAYCKNWTPQSSIQSGIPAEHLTLFAKEWLETQSTDNTVATTYKLSKEVEAEETLLLVEAHATAECTRRLNLRKVQRRVFKYTAPANKLSLLLGAPHQITHSRFGLSGGRAGQIVKLSSDWLKGRVDVEVYI